jgi:hypothetical protein
MVMFAIANVSLGYGQTARAFPPMAGTHGRARMDLPVCLMPKARNLM